MAMAAAARSAARSAATASPTAEARARTRTQGKGRLNLELRVGGLHKSTTHPAAGSAGGPDPRGTAKSCSIPRVMIRRMRFTTLPSRTKARHSPNRDCLKSCIAQAPLPPPHASHRPFRKDCCATFSRAELPEELRGASSTVSGWVCSSRRGAGAQPRPKRGGAASVASPPLHSRTRPRVARAGCLLTTPRPTSSRRPSRQFCPTSCSRSALGKSGGSTNSTGSPTEVQSSRGQERGPFAILGGHGPQRLSRGA